MDLIKMLLPVVKMYFVNNIKNLGAELLEDINQFLLRLYLVNLVSVVAVSFCCLSALSLVTLFLIWLTSTPINENLFFLLTAVNGFILLASGFIIFRATGQIKIKPSKSQSVEFDKVFREVERVIDKYLDSFAQEEKRADLDERLKRIEEELHKINGPDNGPGLQRTIS